MTTRAILILMLLLQQLAMPVAAAAAHHAKDCTRTDCCRVVETTNCCGETVREMRCGMTDSPDCRCGLDADHSRTTPVAPRLGERLDTPLVACTAFAWTISTPRPDRPRINAATPNQPPHHNTQPLLYIWRT